MRAWALAGLGGIVVGWACHGVGAFHCQDDADCAGAAEPGTCAAGFCAFPSDGCSSGLQYGEHAGALAGDCVTGSGSSGEASGTGEPPPPDGSSDGTVDATDTDAPPTGEVEFTDDALRGEFSAGTHESTEWRDERLTLGVGATSGTFTSRVFDAGQVATWDTLTWRPDGPYGKPLPDGGGVEQGYVGGADMSGNVLLIHFDGAAPLQDGDPVPDASGAGSGGVVITDAPVSLVEGIFGAAINDHATSRVAIYTSTAPALAFGEGDFTWSLWFRMNDPCVDNHVYLGVDNAEGSDPNAHLWLGCTNDPWGECAGTVDSPRAAGVLRAVHNAPDDGVGYCSDVPIDGDAWHHAVLVKQGHADAIVTLLLDGVPSTTAAASFAAPIGYPDAPDFTIGSLSRGTYPAVGIFDEVAIWNRALGPDEARAMYERGVLRLSLAVRTCVLPDCADAPAFVEGYVDPATALSPGSVLPLQGAPVGRYVQYRVTMSGPGSVAPALASVTLRGHY